MSVTDNIASVEERIQKACASAGRKRKEVTLMVVTKFIPAVIAQDAFDAGVRCFGESRVKEAMTKFETFKGEHPELKFHLIGSLQRNKAKLAVGFFDCIQSVDREELVGELAKHAPARNTPLDLLLELHTGEESKSGFADIDGLFRAAEQISKCASMRARGLMTMAPLTNDEAQIRGSFRQLVKAQKELGKRFPPAENWACLSMGMSNDFEIAIEEGATMVRIGSLIFGDI